MSMFMGVMLLFSSSLLHTSGINACCKYPNHLCFYLEMVTNFELVQYARCTYKEFIHGIYVHKRVADVKNWRKGTCQLRRDRTGTVVRYVINAVMMHILVLCTVLAYSHNSVAIEPLKLYLKLLRTLLRIIGRNNYK